MKFRIDRSSYFTKEDYENPPCEGAYLDVKSDNDWETNEWAIDINSFEELIKILSDEGPIILFPLYKFNNEYPKIEIYDSYRE